jgi:hypothetical protein
MSIRRDGFSLPQTTNHARFSIKKAQWYTKKVHGHMGIKILIKKEFRTVHHEIIIPEFSARVAPPQFR